MAVPDNGLFGATAGKKSLPTIEVAPARREGEACPAQLERSESVDGPERSAASASSKAAQQNVLRSFGEESCPNALRLSALFYLRSFMSDVSSVAASVLGKGTPGR